ncbi:hypothetical protein ABZZ20_19610 [Streptomyces sp. NPDC006430]|uniref:hypothetical protein n=1 Tax=Streptomyces sp. NPDC006430 TaxID=3154299 RepID=UPI00339FE441
MRLYVSVREGDWASVRYGTYSGNSAWLLEWRLERGDFTAGAGTDRWRDLDRRIHGETFVLSVPDADAINVRTLKVRCLTEARRLGIAAPEPTPAPESAAFHIQDRVMDVWLTDAATDERLGDHLPLGQTELTDGDLVVLSIEHPAKGSYALAAPSNADELLRWLPLAERATSPAGRPRLWGVLLYTDADVELATYVRTHFDDLNVLSGPATRVFAIERPAGRSAARKYWRRHLEPELYRVMGAVRWLRWTPYDAQGAYEVAAELGLGPEHLPCLVFFHALNGPVHEGEKIVFPIEHTSTAYFRSLFAGIGRVLESVEVEEGLPARASDAAAFAAVRRAQDAIRAALRPTVPVQPGLAVHNSRVVVMSGAGVSENFYFHGEKTTFVNRPQDTVIRDFQNTYSAAPGGDELTRLLQLVLTSREVPDPDREEAAVAIHALAREAAAEEPDAPAALTRIDRLRTLLSTGADIAQPALAILASLTAFFGG